MKKKILKEYLPPIIKVEQILFEDGIAQSSVEIKTGDQSGTVRIYDWNVLEDDDLIISNPDNSSWQ